LTDVLIKKSERFGGEIHAPPSKAYTHRMMIAALLSRGASKILNPLSSNDTQVTLDAIEAFGAKVELEETCWTIRGTPSLETPKKPINCGESGSTLRFMIPVAALASGSSIFTPSLSLSKRPLEPLLQSLKQLGAESSFQRDEKGLAIRVHGGGIKGGKTSIRGDVSSQFISGLLFACPRSEENTEITVTTPLGSRSYVQMTLEVLEKHGINVSASKDLKNLDYHTKQGDKAILSILGEMGSKVRVGDEYVEIEGKQLNTVDVDAKDIPDLVPVCAALACYSKGTSKLYNARRLRYKESDRLSSLHAELTKMGADINVNEDGLIIRGPCQLHGAIIDPHNDHRIAMACAVVALEASGETRIRNSECVRKSYPNFFDDLRLLGADVVGG